MVNHSEETPGVARRGGEEPPVSDLFEALSGVLSDGVYQLDAEKRIVAASDALVETTGYPLEAILGEHVSILFADESVERIEDAIRRRLAGRDTEEPIRLTVETAHGESVACELQFGLLREGGDDVGSVGVLRDISEFKARQRELERYERIVGTVWDGIFALDPDDRFVFVNDAYCELTDYESDELLGRPATTVISEEVRDAASELAAEREKGVIGFDMRTKGGESIAMESRLGPYEYDDGRYARCGVVRDITDRKRYEDALTALNESSRALLNATSKPDVCDIVIDVATDVLDLSGVVIYRYEEAEDLLVVDAKSVTAGVGREEFPETAAIDGSIVGHVFSQGASEYYEDVRESPYLQVDADVTKMRSGFSVPIADHGVLVVGATERAAFDAQTRELVELLAANAEAAFARVEHENELQTRVRQQDVVAELGQLALVEQDLSELVDQAVEAVSETLGMDYCGVFELRADDGEVLLRSGAGWADGLVGTATMSSSDDSYAGYTLLSEGPVVVDDLSAEARFDASGLLVDHGVTSGASVVVGPRDDPWGILGAHDRRVRSFTQRDVNFLQSVAYVLAAAIDRADRERELEQFETIVQTVDDSIYVVDEDYRFVLVNDAYEEFIGVPSDELVGSHIREVVSTDIADLGSQLREGLAPGEESGTVELQMEPADGDVRTVEINFSVLRSGGEFSGTTGVIRDITERVERERQLEAQRERLAALNNLYGVVRETTDAIIEQSTREEIERTVCEALAASESYEFAWIGDVARSTGEMYVLAEAGVEDVLSGETTAGDADVPFGHGPTGRAFRTQEVHVVQDAANDPSYARLRDHAAEYGYRSMAAIPIVHDDVLYGVLNVYAARPHAFTDEEQGVVGQLGEIIGHAIAAVERKRALTSDEVVEVDFEIPDRFGGLDVPVGTSDPITMDQTVPTSDDGYLVYGTTTGEGVKTIEAVTERTPHWESVRVIGEDVGRARFELRLSEPPVLMAVAAFGGYVERAEIRDGDYRMTVHLPVGSDVRQVTERIRETYPRASVRAQRQVGRTRMDSNPLVSALEEQLTDRQRTVLESAYFSGFFEWPRESSGRDVANSLDISPPTFSQHIRAAENKIFGALFERPAVVA
jgi:PAS domain S-box-containing protein